jgi:hypothetical protein
LRDVYSRKRWINRNGILKVRGRIVNGRLQEAVGDRGTDHYAQEQDENNCKNDACYFIIEARSFAMQS